MGFFRNIFGLAKSLEANALQRENVEKTIQANKELAEYSYTKDVEMWNMANAYNSPVAQMKRLQDAGLNPNLVYGTGSVVGNTSGTIPKYSAPTVDYRYKPEFNIPQILGMFQDFQVKSAQIDNLNESRRRMELENSMREIDLKMKEKNVEVEYWDRWASMKNKDYDQLWKSDMWRTFFQDEGKDPSGARQWSVKDPAIRDFLNEVYMSRMESPVSELSKTQEDLNRLRLDNEIKRKNINFFIANKVFEYFGKIFSAIPKLK